MSLVLEPGPLMPHFTEAGAGLESRVSPKKPGASPCQVGGSPGDAPHAGTQSGRRLGAALPNTSPKSPTSCARRTAPARPPPGLRGAGRCCSRASARRLGSDSYSSRHHPGGSVAQLPRAGPVTLMVVGLGRAAARWRAQWQAPADRPGTQPAQPGPGTRLPAARPSTGPLNDDGTPGPGSLRARPQAAETGRWRARVGTPRCPIRDLKSRPGQATGRNGPTFSWAGRPLRALSRGAGCHWAPCEIVYNYKYQLHNEKTSHRNKISSAIETAWKP